MLQNSFQKENLEVVEGCILVLTNVKFRLDFLFLSKIILECLTAYQDMWTAGAYGAWLSSDIISWYPSFVCR